MATPKEQLLSRTVYDTDGTTTIWEFAFSGGYLDPSHVKAYTETPLGLRTQLVLPAGSLIGQFQLRILPALAAGNELVIYRDTPKNLPLVDFTDESGFSEIALDTNAKQAVFIAAEAIDTVNTLDVAAAAAAAEVAAVAATNSAAAAVAAAGSASASANSASLAQAQVALAAAQVALATTQANNAQTSANAAAASAASVNPASFVQVTGDQTIGGTKTFSSPIAGSITGNAATATTAATANAVSNGAVGTAGVADDAVTFAKLQNIATATILGRSTAGTGDVEALTGAQATALLSAASETVSGRVELADATEAAAGTDGTRALSPLRLRDALAATGSAPIYACRAWVNFNGTGTVAIRASGNVSSITDNGVGDYTVNFTTAMPDANYAVTISARDVSGTWSAIRAGASVSSSSCSVINRGTTAHGDTDMFCISIFR